MLTAVLAGVRVLVVDDQAVNRLILREMLASRGAAIDEAADGPSALKMLVKASTSGLPYRLLILDCRMPLAWTASPLRSASRRVAIPASRS
jgi:two-component system, sensor histidine kinase and response regulator